MPKALSISRLAALARRIDTAWCLALTLCVFALYPLAARPGLPNGTDVLYHVYRVGEMDRAWTHGVLFPDWAEGLYYGYGSPLFHYYASGTYYLTSVLIRVFGFDALNSLRALIVLSVFASATGMYLFARQQSGRLAGVLSAVCYVYSPYLLYTEPYARGDYPELLAFTVFPFVMWRFERLLVKPSGLNAVWAAILLAVLILVHNLMALALTGLLVAWLLWGWLTNSRHTWFRKTITRLMPSRRTFLQQRNFPPLSNEWRGTGGEVNCVLAFLCLLLGIALAAYFWLPVLLEHDEVHLSNLIAGALLDFRNFFVPLGDLLAFSPRADAETINGLTHQLNLGVAQWLLALTGIVGLVIALRRTKSAVQSPNNEVELPKSDRASRPFTQGFYRILRTVVNSALSTQHSALIKHAAFFALMSLAMIALMLPLAAGIWDHVSALAFLQFPWRFLGPTAFCLAMLAGMNAVWLERLPNRWKQSLTAILVALPVAVSLPLLYVPEWVHATVDTSIQAYQQSEVAGLQRGTTFTNEYLPKHVDDLADSTSWLLDEYATHYAPGGDGQVNKANRARIPPDATLELLNHSPQSDSWHLHASTPFTMEVLTHDFAGWRAEVDGQSVEITASNPHGFINFPVPAGDHSVVLYLGSTPARDLGKLVSVVAVIGLAIVIFLIHKGDLVGRPCTPLRDTLERGSGGEVAFPYLGLLAGLVLSAALVVVFMRPGLAWVQSPPGTAQVAQHQVIYNLGDSLQVLGYDLNASTFAPGDTLKLSVYWYARAAVPYQYQVFVHVSTGGPPLAQADRQNPAGRPTTHWTPDGYIRDDYEIALPATMSPGEYNLLVGLYTCETMPAGQCGNGDRLKVTDATGKSLGDAVLLQTITVK